MQKQGEKYLQILGNKISKIRNKKGISQQELADDADVAKSTIQRIEAGSMNPKVLTLKSICIALKIEISEILE